MRERSWGLDKPFLTQYFVWLGNLLHGDMGTSYISGQDVFPTFLSKLPATLLLTAVSIVLTIVISVPLGDVGRRQAEPVGGLCDPGSELFGEQHAELFCRRCC